MSDPRAYSEDQRGPHTSHGCTAYQRAWVAMMAMMAAEAAEVAAAEQKSEPVLADWERRWIALAN
jgi:hypothetical protein